MATHIYTFSKEERLCGEIRIAELFRTGQSAMAYPVRACWNYTPGAVEDIPVKVLMSVPKKKHHRANRRNRLKRLMRESYRLQKSLLTEVLERQGGSLQIAFVWQSDELADYSTVFAKMGKALEKIRAAVETSSEAPASGEETPEL